MTVINPKTGREFDWAEDPWKKTTRARWSKRTLYGGQVIGSVRNIAHIDYLDRRARKIFGPSHGLQVLQSAFNDTVEASKGTHDKDMVDDLWIPGIDPWRQQRFYRNHGFWGWYRPYVPGLWRNHYHGFSMVPYGDDIDPSKAFANRGFKVGVYIDGGWSLYGRRVATSQVEDFVHRAFGLKDRHTAGSDRSFMPRDLHDTIFDLHAYIARRKQHQAAA